MQLEIVWFQQVAAAGEVLVKNEIRNLETAKLQYGPCNVTTSFKTRALSYLLEFKMSNRRPCKLEAGKNQWFEWSEILDSS